MFNIQTCMQTCILANLPPCTCHQVLLNLSIFTLVMIFKIVFTGFIRDRGGKNRDFLFPVSLPRWPGLARLKPGTKGFFWLFHMDGSGPGIGDVFFCFPRYIQRELDCK